MIKGIMKILDLVQQMFLPKGLLIAGLVWLVLFLICYILGGIALWRMGKNGGHKKLGLAWLPGVQIYCEAAFTDKPHTARRIQHCLWWFFALAAGCLADGVWMIAGFLGEQGVQMGILKIIFIFLLALMAVLYFLIRADELTCLRKVLDNDLLWGISIFGSILCIPIQRIFLFSLSEEEEE